MVPAATRVLSPFTGPGRGYQTLNFWPLTKNYSEHEGVTEVQNIVSSAAWKLAFQWRRAPAGGAVTEERHSAPHPGEECGSAWVMLVQRQRDPPN